MNVEGTLKATIVEIAVQKPRSVTFVPRKSIFWNKITFKWSAVDHFNVSAL